MPSNETTTVKLACNNLFTGAWFQCAPQGGMVFTLPPQRLPTHHDEGTGMDIVMHVTLCY